MIRVLSLGAGVQSTTLLLMSCLGELPLLDAAVFADTQWEPAAVYQHLSWLTEYASKAGIPVHQVSAGNLRTESLLFLSNGVGVTNRVGVGGRWASLPLYVKGGGIMNRQCTKYYKILPVDRFIKRTLLDIEPGKRAADDSAELWIGFSADESKRLKKVKRRHKWQTIRLPLIHDVEPAAFQNGYRKMFHMGFDRFDCLSWLRLHGFAEPPRSACIDCPFRSDAEWLLLPPNEFADACAYDDALRMHGEELYVHRSCVPLREVVFDVKKNWDGVRDNECLGMCGS